MTDPGILKQRLVLEAPVETADDAGGVLRSYAPAAFLWAAVDPIDARADTRGGDAGATIRSRITVRAGPEITTRHRLRQGSRLWRIVSVREADRSGRLLAIEAEERFG